MVYNEQNHEIAITGATIGNYFRPTDDAVIQDTNKQNADNNSTKTSMSDCFVAILRLPHVDASGHMTDPNQLSWIRRRQYGTSTAHEFCSDLVWKSGSIVVAGHTAGQGGLLTSLLPHGNDHRLVYGIVLELNSAAELQGGVLLHSNKVQFPRVEARDLNGNIYVVDLFSEYVDDSATYVDDQNFFATGGLSQYHTWKDASFAVRIQRLEPLATHGDNEASMSSRWMREYGTMRQESVMVSSLTCVKDRLVMTGYTAGSSSAFGESTHSNEDGDGSDEVVDSFLTVFDPETGDLARALRMAADEDSVGHFRVMQLCHLEKTNAADGVTESDSQVFVVGTNEMIHQNTSFAFVQKVNLATMEIEWKREIHGTLFPATNEEGKGPKVHGVACAVTNDGKDVYVAGNIMDGTILGDDQQGNTRRLRESTLDTNMPGDIFVSKFDTSDGSLAFSRQIGSDGNDAVAPGKSLATDAEGNLIVLANTEGSLYHQNLSPEGASEILVFSVGRAIGDFYLPHPRTKETDLTEGETVEGDSNERQEKFLNAIYALLTSLTVMVLLVVGIRYWRRPKRSEYRSGLHQYEGIWRTAAFESAMTNDHGLSLAGRRDDRREQRYLEIDRARRISASATIFPLGSFSDKERSGDVYDLLAIASERNSKTLADDQARARARLAEAVRATTSFDQEDIPDISK
jgi:hypothetical protein